ncbi:MAG TPA: SIS domain-containing protein [Candidatus Nanoarchaeia archaeon]|nr:SIS domain-containing protein [Candidatus Nanoarchaeia archaeon]
MEDSIQNIAGQFAFEPVIEHEDKLKPAQSFIVGGMGGSHLSAGLLKIIDPSVDLYIHRDYDLPTPVSDWHKKSLHIASSYSGNTEETLDFAEKAFAGGYNLAVISTGGKLIEFAKQHSIPHIVLPRANMQPRVALGVSLIALAKLVGGDMFVKKIQGEGLKLDPLRWKEVGGSVAEELKGKIPVIYSSRQNLALAYSWKIKCNETAKIPAFYNVLPELNHNEMNGFDVIKSTKKLSNDFSFIFLEDDQDHPKISRRMNVLKKVYEDRGLSVKTVPLTGSSVFEKVFNSLLLADWTALSLSRVYETEPEQVPMVEEFKKLIS